MRIPRLFGVSDVATQRYAKPAYETLNLRTFADCKEKLRVMARKNQTAMTVTYHNLHAISLCNAMLPSPYRDNVLKTQCSLEIKNFMIYRESDL